MSALAGRVALVTGAGRGIGAATAGALAAAGAAVAVAARTEAAAAGPAGRIAAAGGTAMALPCDVADPAAAAAAVAAVQARFGRLDILINNAGTIAPIAPLGDCAPADWARSIAVNLLGAFHMVQAALPALLAAPGGGTVINLTSGAALRPMEGWSAYCSGKAGLLMLTRCLDLEYRDRGLRAVAFAPGLVDTDMQAGIRASGINPVSALPRDALAPADEPARAMVWLCGPGAQEHLGAQVDIRDAALRAAVGLRPLPD